ncbi:XRE family transcriptional regulator [Secundilactobacillus pentosiphilus]|uniref:XRE family transcriptional regulator n=1 Tax=Secundilactobacillus pentosiphilus TaxID=1714682 RepID=A0A1Z5IYI6_9LACO|nr:helix-turn-helix transcriptional regulator [Secundilactobacillus pentosiphilus]GAX06843.1 XRE family transcriptional regulator [Secundilactobacillus pentosiphilus]
MVKTKKRLELIKLRNDHNWSRKDVAELLDIAEITVRSIENGVRNPGTKLATKFAFLYDVKVETVFPDIFLPDDDTKRIIQQNKQKIAE